MSEPARVRVTNNEAPVHCIDIVNSNGDRLCRIRPNPASCGISMNFGEGRAAFLNFDDFDELLGALSRIQITQGNAIEDLVGRSAT